MDVGWFVVSVELVVEPEVELAVFTCELEILVEDTRLSKAFIVELKISRASLIVWIVDRLTSSNELTNRYPVQWINELGL